MMFFDAAVHTRLMAERTLILAICGREFHPATVRWAIDTVTLNPMHRENMRADLPKENCDV